MYPSIVDSKYNSLIEPTETGRSRPSSPLTLSWITEPRVFPMVFLIAMLALAINATAAQRVWPSHKLMTLTHVVMTAKLTVNGNKEFTLVSIVIWISSMLCALGKDFLQPTAPQNLDCLQTVVQLWQEKLASSKNDH